MDAWGNFWQKGHSTTFGEYYADGYTKGYISQWWETILETHNKDDLSILEVGCGNASLLPCTLDYKVKGHYYGVDAAKVTLSAAVEKRINGDLAVSLTSNKKIEEYQPNSTFDLIASVYGVEYSNLEQSLPSLRAMLAPDGQINFLMHHSGSVITDMSEKALGEFDFESMTTIVDHLKTINSELNKLKGKLAKLKKSEVAEHARIQVNEFVSNTMNESSDDRNPILVDFCVMVLGFFKKIQQPRQERKDYLESIMPDFYASKERFRQMVEVARNADEIEIFKENMTNAGFSEVIIEPMNKDGKPVAWKITAN